MGETTSSQHESMETRAAPRLSIFHFMLWMLCSAVYLSLIRAIVPLQDEMPEGYAALQSTSSVFSGVIRGAAIMGTFVLVSARLRGGPPMLRYPGHWLLLISAAVDLIILPLNLIVMLLQEATAINARFLVVYAIAYLIVAFGYSIAALSVRPLRWKLLFGVMAGLAGLQSLVLIGYWLDYGFAWNWWFFVFESAARILVGAGVLIVSIVDFACNHRRDWLHWTGIATYLANTGVSIFWMIGLQFVDRS